MGSQSQATPHSRGADAARVRPLGGEVQFRSCLPHCLGFPGGSVVKNLPAMKGTRVQSLSWEGPLEKGMATDSSILAWRIPWTDQPGWGTVHGVTKG